MNRQAVITGVAAVVVVVLAVVAYLYFNASDNGAPAPQPITGAERAEEARNVIAELEQARAANPAQTRPATPAPRPAAGSTQPGTTATPRPAADAEPGAGAEIPATATAAPTGAGADLDAAFERAQEFQRAGQLADAQLLLFYGARAGHGPSAFALATMNDPAYHSSETSLLPEPDAFQAYRWYAVARDQGMPGAEARLAALHEWARSAADGGDADAERLLLQWE